MIPIRKNQDVPTRADLQVCADTGEYGDADFILCAKKDRPEFAVEMFQAQFVRYGSVVYQFNTQEELGAALFAADPDSTHDAVALYKEEQARQAARRAGTLEPEKAAPAPDSEDGKLPDAEQDAHREEQDEDHAEDDADEEQDPAQEDGGGAEGTEQQEEATTTAPVPEAPPPSYDESSTTPDLLENLPAATSTPPLPDAAPEATSTSAMRSAGRKIAKNMSKRQRA
jgi:hypothetical protein